MVHCDSLYDESGCGSSVLADESALLTGWPRWRMNKEGAIAGLLVGLFFTLIMIVLMRANVVLGFEEPILDTFLGLGLYGSILNFVVALAISRFTPAPPDDVQQLVQEVRLPRGSHDVVTGEGVEADGGEPSGARRVSSDRSDGSDRSED